MLKLELLFAKYLDWRNYQSAKSDGLWPSFNLLWDFSRKRKWHSDDKKYKGRLNVEWLKSAETWERAKDGADF